MGCWGLLRLLLWRHPLSLPGTAARSDISSFLGQQKLWAQVRGSTCAQQPSYRPNAALKLGDTLSTFTVICAVFQELSPLLVYCVNL